MPPVGHTLTPGKGLASALMKAVPPDAFAGKNFTALNPSSWRAIISDTVAAPGRSGSPAARQPEITSFVVPGDTAKAAPASRA